MADDAAAIWREVAAEAKRKGNTAELAAAEKELKALERAAAPAAPAPTDDDEPVDLPAAVAKPPPEPKFFERVGNAITSAGGKFADQLGSELGTVARGLGLVDLPDTPEILDRESRAETLSTRALNSATLGGSDYVANKAIGPGARYYREELAKNKGSGFVGDLLGAVAGGVAGGGRVVGEAVTRGAAKLLPKVAAKMTGAGGRAVSGAGTGLAENAVQNVVESEGDLSTAADDPYLAAAFGGGIPLVGAALGYAAKKVRGLSPWIDRYRKGVDAGEYNPPPVADDRTAGQKFLGEEPTGIQERPRAEADEYVQGERVKSRRAASDKAVHKFAQRRGELVDESRQTLRKAREPHLQRPISRKAMRADIQEQIKANLDPATKKPINEDLHAALSSELKYVGKLKRLKKGGQPSTLLDAEGNPMPSKREYEDIPDSTLEATIRRRQAHKEGADWNNPSPSDAAKLSRRKARISGDAIKRNAPAEVRTAEREAFERAKRLERDEDIVFRTEAEVARDGSTATDVTPSRPRDVEDDFTVDDLEPTAIDENISALRAAAERQAAEGTGKVDMRVAKELAGSDFFGRVGDTNEPGLRVEGLLEELAKRDPDGYAKIIEFVRATKARDATKFGLMNQVPTNLPGAMSILNRFAQLGRFAGGRVAVPALEGGGEALQRMPAGRLVPFLRDPVDSVQERERQKKRKEKRE